MTLFQQNTLFLALILSGCAIGQVFAQQKPDFEIQSTQVNWHQPSNSLLWEIEVKGNAGKTTPKPIGQLDGAGVFGYVFPTNLSPQSVGFDATEGILALALTSHPDFDDTPLWDENSDSRYDNDGIVWHPHWVVLVKDSRVAGGLSVKPFDKEHPNSQLPPTNPGMPMYMDSPGFQVTTEGNTIRVLIPAYRLNNQLEFKFDAVTCFMRVNTSNKNMPMLGVYEVYSIASGDLSLPFQVQK